MDPIELALISLYHALDPAGFDLSQLGTPTQVDDMSQDPDVLLPGLTAAVDLDTRRDRYAANLAYVLGTRYVEAGGSLDAELKPLGLKILDRFGVANPAGPREPALRDAVTRLLPNGVIVQDVVDDLEIAFAGKVQASFDPLTNTWAFSGPATEPTAMLCELASMGMNCRGRTGTVRLGTEEVEVLVLECEVCTQATWERTMVGVDPRNWPTYNPSFFQSVHVLTTNQSAPTGWTGVIQEAVGALVTGTPIVTNLVVSYHQEAGLAVTAYDLSNDSSLTPDDGTVKVDYGFFSVTDEGVHRRIKLIKVLRIDGVTVPTWVGPLWAQQLGMIGWWF